MWVLCVGASIVHGQTKKSINQNIRVIQTVQSRPRMARTHSCRAHTLTRIVRRRICWLLSAVALKTLPTGANHFADRCLFRLSVLICVFMLSLWESATDCELIDSMCMSMRVARFESFGDISSHAIESLSLHATTCSRWFNYLCNNPSIDWHPLEVVKSFDQFTECSTVHQFDYNV